MALSPRLEQSLKPMQQMILSPQMQQAIQILQMPIMELRLKIAEEMALNPLIEEKSENTPGLEESLEILNTEQRESDTSTDETFDKEFERLANLDDEWKNHFKQANSQVKHNSQDEEKRRYMESSISLSESLHEHLLHQLTMLELDQESLKICEFIIGSIDRNGYLSISTDNITESLNITEEEVEKNIARIQKLNPLGVGARDLKECLFIQINSMDDTPPYVREVIENHLEDLGKNKYPAIAKKLKTSIQEIQEAASFIATLEPKPGRIFGQDTVTYITPDIFIVEKGDDYEVILNDDRIPHLHISNLYKKVMTDSDSQDETKNYIRNKVRSGMWLIRNIQQRQETIFNIMKKIIEIQKPFLRGGVSHLKPLTMQDVATELGIHESTVSRAVSKKYVQSPQGLLPAKYFFSVEMKTYDGGSTSSRNIKQQIKDIIDNEDTKNPLSDNDIVTLLKNENIKISRRTVTKYRKELSIPSSPQRRSY